MARDAQVVARLQDVVDLLAQQLGRAVVVNDIELAPLAASAQGSPVDPARVDSIMQRQTPHAIVDFVLGLGIRSAPGPVVVAANPTLGTLARLCVPLRHQGRLYGFLWLITDGAELDTQAMTVVTDAAREATSLFVTQAQAVDARLSRDRRLLTALLSGNGAARDGAATEVEAALAPSGGAGHRLTVFRPRDLDVQASAVLRPSLLTPDDDFLVATMGRDIVVLTAASGRSMRGVAAVVEASRTAMWQGASRPFTELHAAPAAFEEAQYAALIASLVPDVGGVADYGELGAWLLLRGLPWTTETIAALSPAALVLADPRHHVLRATVLAALDNAGDVAATVTGLAVHRTTFYYRLDRVRALIGDDWDSGWKRTALHAALRLQNVMNSRDSSSRR